MVGSRPMPVVNVRSRRWIWIGALLLVAGLLGHLFAARAIGGSYVAYRDHIFGFILLSLVSGAVIAALGWRFWRGRHDITLVDSRRGSGACGLRDLSREIPYWLTALAPGRLTRA